MSFENPGLEKPKYTNEVVEEEAAKMQDLIASGEAKDYKSAEKKIEREKGLAEITAKIEEMRKNGLLENETANLASESLKLEGDEAMFANRLISRGSDPASLELALTGSISEPTMRAHKAGPGALKEDEKKPWLILAAASIDEHGAVDMPVTEKFKQFYEAAKWIETASEEEKDAAAQKELEKILSIPFEESEVNGIKMRVYTSDRGFASAYWSGEEYAAVKQGKLTFIGSQSKSFEELGIKVDKQLSPTFGICFEK